MTAVNTLTQPDAFQADAQVSAADPAAGSRESKTQANQSSRVPPHLEPAKK